MRAGALGFRVLGFGGRKEAFPRLLSGNGTIPASMLVLDLLEGD